MYPPKRRTAPAISKTQLILGRKPLLETLHTQPENVERVYLQTGAHGDEIQQIIQLCKSLGVPLLRVPASKLQRLTAKNHQGVIGFSALIRFLQIDHIVSYLFEKGETPLILIVDDVTDVGNIGAMARTAWISGFQAILFPYLGVPALQEGAIKASAGALSHIHICRSPHLGKTIDELKLQGLQVVAATIDGALPLHRVDFSLPTAVVMGNEQHGISPELRLRCTHTFTIPMKKELNSYNVSVSFGMIAYEAMMQQGFRAD